MMYLLFLSGQIYVTIPKSFSSTMLFFFVTPGLTYKLYCTLDVVLLEPSYIGIIMMAAVTLGFIGFGFKR